MIKGLFHILKVKSLCKVLALVFLFSFSKSWGQIATQDFEASPASPTWGICAGGTFTSSSTGATDTPASQRIRGGSRSWQTSNATNTLDLCAVSVSGCTSVQVVLYISSTSVSGTNGADAADLLKVSANVDGAGFPATPDITVAGNTNARWGYNTTGVSTNAGTPVSVAGTSGTNQGTIYSKLIINIPNGSTSVALRIVANNNDANEVWNVDDIQISGTCSSCTPPTTTITPTSQTVCAGTATTISVSSSATVPSYTWQSSSTSGGSYSNVVNGTPSGAVYSGTNTSVLTVTAGSTYYYRCLVAENGTCTATSGTSTLVVNTAPSVSTPTISSTTSCAGSTSVTVKVTASGTAPLSYQWQVSTGGAYSNISGGAYTGETTGTLSIGNSITAGTYSYQCIVTNACGSATGAVSAHTVVALPAAPNVAPTAASVSCEPAIITEAGTASAGVNWYWETSATGTSTGSLTTSTYSFYTNNTNYETYTVYVRAQTTTGSCWSSTTTPVSITATVVNTPTISSPTSTTVTPGATVQFTANANGGTTSGCSSLYQWQENTGSGFTNISNGGIYSGATTATLTISPASDAMTGYTYRCVITSCACGNFTTNTATLTVSSMYSCLSEGFESGLTGAYQTTNFNLTSGTWTGTNVANGNGTFRSGSNSCQLQSTTGSNIITPTLTDPATVTFWARVSSGTGNVQLNYSSNGGSTWGAAAGSPFSLTTTWTQFTVNLGLTGNNILQFYRTAGTVFIDDVSVTCGLGCTAPTTTISPVTQTICSGSSATVSVSSSASSPSYTWQSSSNGSSGWSAVTTGTNAINVSPGSTIYYRALVSEGGTCTATSSTAQVIVNTVPAISSQPISVTTTSTGTASYTVTATGGNLTYQWLQNTGAGFVNVTNGGTNPTYAGATSSVLTISNPPMSMSGYSYQCIVTNACGTATTNGVATLSVTTVLVCPVLKSAVINSCDGCASEGNNEFLVLNTNSYSFNVNPTNVNIVYSNGPTNLTSSFAAQPASLATLNTATTNACGTTFVDVSDGTTTVPANSVLLIINKGACFTGDWSDYCGLGNVYVAFSSVAAWTTTGFFGNNSTARDFVTDFSAVGSTCGPTTYAYNQAGVAGTPYSFGTDGASVVFNGSSAPTYIGGNGNCAPPIVILPIQLLDFYGTQNGAKNDLIWKVAVEENINYYIVEKSKDGVEFEIFTTANIKEQSASDKSYSVEDDAPFDDITYYRLSTKEKDGSVKHYNIISVDENATKWDYNYYQQEGNLVVEFRNSVPKNSVISLHDLSGKLLAEESVKQAQTKLSIDEFAPGIYFVKISSPYKTENFKIVIQN